MQLFQKLRAPFLGFEAHEDEVIGHKDGTFHQHAVGGKQCKHFRILHGGELILQLQGSVKKPAGIEELFQLQAAFLLPRCKLL